MNEFSYLEDILFEIPSHSCYQTIWKELLLFYHCRFEYIEMKECLEIQIFVLTGPTHRNLRSRVVSLSGYFIAQANVDIPFKISSIYAFLLYIPEYKM